MAAIAESFQRQIDAGSAEKAPEPEPRPTTTGWDRIVGEYLGEDES
jgi:hypothetical protein